MLSIIIITLNEEKMLPGLLESIRKQEFKDYEIIVSDAGSKDNTVDIAKNHGCKVVKGGLPAKGRNEGVKAAQGDLILLLDADCLLPDNFLAKAVEEFNAKNLQIATCLMNPFGESKTAKIYYTLFFNLPSLLFEKIWPNGTCLVFIEKELHKKIGGVDEELRLGEDHDYIRRASKKGKYGIIKSVRFAFSERRFEKDGWIKVFFKYLGASLHAMFIGPVKSDIFKYKFDHYDDKK